VFSLHSLFPIVRRGKKEGVFQVTSEAHHLAHGWYSSRGPLSFYYTTHCLHYFQLAYIESMGLISFFSFFLSSPLFLSLYSNSACVSFFLLFRSEILPFLVGWVSYQICNSITQGPQFLSLRLNHSSHAQSVLHPSSTWLCVAGEENNVLLY
jgi:hypothetical protein